MTKLIKGKNIIMILILSKNLEVNPSLIIKILKIIKKKIMRIIKRKLIIFKFLEERRS